MRNSPVLAVNPDSLDEADRIRLSTGTVVAEQTGTIDLSQLPKEVAVQLLFALQALSRGETVAVVARGKALTTTEAASLLGMSRSHLIQLCDEGRVDSYLNGTQRRVPLAEVQRILVERNNFRIASRPAAETVAQTDLTKPVERLESQDASPSFANARIDEESPLVRAS
jgi:excisionase family DNA binding protein